VVGLAQVALRHDLQVNLPEGDGNGQGALAKSDTVVKAC
jgi:hypothetical protein